uniref:MHC class I antigen n=1 Tax=Plectus sambesii TaxID=2011161 RepID=A0A914WQT4_9BILA
MILGEELNDVDAEFSCSSEKALQACRGKWQNMCRLVGGRDKLEFGSNQGDDGIPLEAFNWNETFYGETVLWEYTANSLGFYDDGNKTGSSNKVIVDLSGYGFHDACSRTIRIPGEQSIEAFEKWLIGYNRPMAKQVSQLLRFWKLRQKNFTAVDAMTQGWVVNRLCEMTTPQHPEGFLPFYCSTIRGGLYASDKERNEYFCLVGSADQNSERVKTYEACFQADLPADCWNELNSYVSLLKYITAPTSSPPSQSNGGTGYRFCKSGAVLTAGIFVVFMFS